jgi:hypothetical protein
MMLSKVYCVHLINAMGYDVLFQDVDVIWYQNPIEYFQLPISGNFDISFQDGAFGLMPRSLCTSWFLLVLTFCLSFTFLPVQTVPIRHATRRIPPTVDSTMCATTIERDSFSRLLSA